MSVLPKREKSLLSTVVIQESIWYRSITNVNLRTDVSHTGHSDFSEKPPISSSTPSGSPDHIISDVLLKLISFLGSFNIIHLHYGDPASVDQLPAYGLEHNRSKNISKEKKIHEALHKAAPTEHRIKCVAKQSLPHEKA